MTHFWSGPLRGTFFLEAFDFNAFVQCLLRHWTLPDATQLGGIPRLNRLLVAVMYLHEHEVFRKLFIVTRAQEHKAPDVGGRTTFSKSTFQILVGILLDLRFRPFVLCLTFEFADRKSLPSRVIVPLPEPPTTGCCSESSDTLATKKTHAYDQTYLHLNTAPSEFCDCSWSHPLRPRPLHQSCMPEVNNFAHTHTHTHDTVSAKCTKFKHM
jgi:hypothetical protein